MNRDNQNIIQSDAGLVTDVRDMIQQTRSSLSHTVNTGMTFLYWRIGKRIHMEVLKYERAEYGRQIIATLSQELSVEFGRGYSYSALTRKVKFHEVAPDEEIVAALRRQSGWTRFRALIPIRRQSPIWFTRIRTTESSDNRPISCSESSDQALESPGLAPSTIRGATSAELQCRGHCCPTNPRALPMSPTLSSDGRKPRPKSLTKHCGEIWRRSGYE